MNYKEKYTPGLSKSDTEGLSKYTEPAFSLEEYIGWRLVHYGGLSLPSLTSEYSINPTPPYRGKTF